MYGQPVNRQRRYIKNSNQQYTCTYKWQRLTSHFAHEGGIRSFHELEVLEFLLELWRSRVGDVTGAERLVVGLVMLRRDLTLAVVDLVQQTLLKARHFEALQPTEEFSYDVTTQKFSHIGVYRFGKQLIGFRCTLVLTGSGTRSLVVV